MNGTGFKHGSPVNLERRGGSFDLWNADITGLFAKPEKTIYTVPATFGVLQMIIVG